MGISPEQARHFARKLTPEQRRAAGFDDADCASQSKTKQNRFHNRPVPAEEDLILHRRWDSTGEMRCGHFLAALEKGGAISDLEFQVPVVLLERPKIVLRVDFAYTEHGQRIHTDFKSRSNYDKGPTREMYRDWIVKRDLWIAGFGPGPLYVFYPEGSDRFGVHEYQVDREMALDAVKRLTDVTRHFHAVSYPHGTKTTII